MLQNRTYDRDSPENVTGGEGAGVGAGDTIRVLRAVLDPMLDPFTPARVPVVSPGTAR